MRRALTLVSRYWGAVLAALLAGATPAHAALKLCNRTSYILYAATSSVSATQRTTQGWTRIAPGDCKDAIASPLTTAAYYVYARTSLAHAGASRAWGGSEPVCVRTENFSLRAPVQAFACAADAYGLPFARVATRGNTSWTMNFDEAPGLSSLTAAQLAGVKRLLHDNGYKTGTIDGAPDKATGAALETFRKKMRFAPDAGNDALFDALEVQALKSVAPAGYTVCNDSTGAIAVAMGQQEPASAVSRGWWKIAGGNCAKLLNTLASDKIYLFAQKSGGAALVSGPEKFCVADLEFEIHDRANCARRGLSEVGFAATSTHGLSGYAAHVGNGGLVGHQGAMSK